MRIHKHIHAKCQKVKLKRTKTNQSLLSKFTKVITENVHHHRNSCMADPTAYWQLSNPFGRLAQVSQKRACPHGTNANPSRGATRQTSQQSTGTAAAGPTGSGAAVDCAGPGAWSSMSSSLFCFVFAHQLRHDVSLILCSPCPPRQCRLC